MDLGREHGPYWSIQTAAAPPTPAELAPIAARLYRDRFLHPPSRVLVTRSPLEGVEAAGRLARAERSVHAAITDAPGSALLRALPQARTWTEMPRLRAWPLV